MENFDRRFDTVPTHLRQQMRTQIVALVENFETYMVALDTTLWISQHRALNMPYIQPTHGATSIEDSTPFLPPTTANEDANCSSSRELRNVYGGVGYNFLDFST